MCPLAALLCVCGVLGHLATVHQCARWVCCFACAVSWATWLLLAGVPARCVAVRVRCPGPLGCCSPVCRRGLLCCVCGVLGHLAPVHMCARSVRCFACAVSLATWLLFTGVPAWFVVLLVHCPGLLGSCSPVCLLGVLFCLCGVLGHLALAHRCARLVCCVACAVFLATWLLFTGLPAWGVALPVRCPGPLGSCSPVCPLGLLCCVCGVLGHLAPVHRCARLVCCFAYAVSWATWLVFTGVPARCVALRVRCPGPLGSCSPVCPLGVLFCWCGVLGHSAPVHRCARWVGCFACAVSWATCLLFTGVPPRCVGLLVVCPWPLGSCSPECPLGALPVCAVSWATWLLFTRVTPWYVVLLLRCPGPLASCSPVCLPAALLCLCGVLGPWLLFTFVPARCVVLRVRCPGPPGSCSSVCPLGVFRYMCGVLHPLAPVHRCARPVCCAVSWASWLLFTGGLTQCVLLWVACAGRCCGAHTRSSGRRLFVAGRGWVPSGRALVDPDGGCS